MAVCVIKNEATSFQISRFRTTRAEFYRVIAGVVRPDVERYGFISDKLVLHHRESILRVVCTFDLAWLAMSEQLGLVAFGRDRR